MPWLCEMLPAAKVLHKTEGSEVVSNFNFENIL